MKLPSPKEAHILSLLISGSEMYGSEMLKTSNELKRTSIYVILGRMEEQGLIAGREVKELGTPGVPRRVYRVTGLGQKAYRALIAAECILGANVLPEGAQS